MNERTGVEAKEKVMFVKCEMNNQVAGLTTDNDSQEDVNFESHLPHGYNKTKSTDGSRDLRYEYGWNGAAERGMGTGAELMIDDSVGRGKAVKHKFTDCRSGKLLSGVDFSLHKRKKRYELSMEDSVTGGLRNNEKSVVRKATKRRKQSSSHVDVLEKDVCRGKSIKKGSDLKTEDSPNTEQMGKAKGVMANKLHVQRRILANARERSRVHKLGEAFRMLRDVIPSFSADQKLSKLSTLRIAVCYMTALSSLLEVKADTNNASHVFASNVDQCSAVLQSEFGRAKGTKKFKAQLGGATKQKKAKMK